MLVFLLFDGFLIHFRLWKKVPSSILF